jgi:peptidoglycan/xylan/chitin deacetylase (PgdA/CDA1 family)
LNYLKNFKLISLIEVGNRASWENKLFLTFDVDLEHEEVITDTLGLLHKYDVQATFFGNNRLYRTPDE